MSSTVDNTTVITFQGDTCKFTLTELEEGMIVYLSVRDKRDNSLVFPEIVGIANASGEINYIIPPEYTNKFIVRPKYGYNDYYFGFKQVDEETGEENTILLGDEPAFNDMYIMRVYLKKSEGLVE